MNTPLAALNEQDRRRALQALAVVGTLPEPAFDQITQHVAALWGAPMVAIALIEADRQWFKSRVGIACDETPRTGSFCAHLIASSANRLVVADAREDPRFCGNPLVTGGPGIRSYAGSVLTDETGHRLGALCVLDYSPRQPTPEQLEALDRLALVVSGMLVMQRSVRALAGMAACDALTGVANRRGLEAAAAVHPGRPGGLMMLDMDRFKAINDAYGLAVGDVALAEAAARIVASVRAEDTVARVGGDEFVVLVPGATELAQLEAPARRIEAALARPWIYDGRMIQLGASIGTAVGALSSDGLANMVHEADAAMGMVKRLRTLARAA